MAERSSNYEIIRQNVAAIPEVVELLAARFLRTDINEGLEIISPTNGKIEVVFDNVAQHGRRRLEEVIDTQGRIIDLARRAAHDSAINLGLLFADNAGVSIEVSDHSLIDWSCVRDALREGRLKDALQVLAPATEIRDLDNGGETKSSREPRRKYANLELLTQDEIDVVGELREKLELESREWSSVILDQLIDGSGSCSEQDVISAYLSDGRIRNRDIDWRDAVGQAVSNFKLRVIPRICELSGLQDVSIGWMKDESEGQKVIRLVIGRKKQPVSSDGR